LSANGWSLLALFAENLFADLLFDGKNAATLRSSRTCPINDAICRSEEGIIFADVHVATGLNMRASLADKIFPGDKL
jgi:hypothetical protein